MYSQLSIQIIIYDQFLFLQDGTFRVAPSQFYQIYTISIEHEGYSLPVCWAFLGRATADIYQDLLRAILTRFRELDIQMEPKTIFTDFEAAMISVSLPK